MEGKAMRITVTVTIERIHKSFDLQVNNQQRIKDTLQILAEGLNMDTIRKNRYIQSKRTNYRIETTLTYEQAKIFTGDELMV